MSIILSPINESLGRSYEKVVKSYLKGKSTIDEYQLGQEMAEDLTTYSKLLKCSESSVVFIRKSDASDKEKSLYNYILRNITKSIKKFKLADEDSIANLYSINSALVIVADVAYDSQYIIYSSKDEIKFTSDINEGISLDESLLKAQDASLGHPELPDGSDPLMYYKDNFSIYVQGRTYQNEPENAVIVVAEYYDDNDINQMYRITKSLNDGIKLAEKFIRLINRGNIDFGEFTRISKKLGFEWYD